jgi:hypothetical protein
LIFSIEGLSQSVYYFQYKLPLNNDTSLYKAFFVRYNDGSGFVRIRTDKPSLLLVELNLQQKDVEISLGVPDTTKMLFDTVGKANFIFGSNKSTFPIPRFHFNRNKTTNSFDETGVVITDQEDKTTANILSSSQFSADGLTRDLVSRFFTPGEDFYVNAIETTSRGFNALERKLKMYLLIVANTNDPSIGKGCVYDTTRAIELFQSIAKYIGIPVVKKVIAGKTYNKASVERMLAELKPDLNDIVIFYYTGHGFRKPTDKRIFPYIDLRPKDDRTYMVNSLHMEDILKTIRNKPTQARLNLLISDCCNNIPGKIKSPGKSIVGFRDIRDWSEDNVRQLFLNPMAQSVMMTAADVDQLAACDTTDGSLFTTYFKAALENNLTRFKSKNKVNWDQVVREAKDKLSEKARHTYCGWPPKPENICQQDPIPKLIMGRGN